MTQSAAAKKQLTPHESSVPGSPLQLSPPHALDDSFGATWRYDLGSGLVVFLVALPLCLGIALASGAPLFSGVITGLLGGLLISRLSGSHLMVSGPAAGLTAIVLASITQLGAFDKFLAAVVIAGVMQFALGALRAGIIGYFFPSSVIRGMLAAIGLILILKQLPYALGVGVELFELDSFIGQTGGNSFSAVATALRAILPAAFAITILSLCILAGWNRMAPAALRRVMPAALVVVLLGVLGNMALSMLAPSLALPKEALVSLPMLKSVSDLGSLFTFPDWSAFADPAIYRIAVTIALVASLETLLSLEATDKLDPYKRSAPANRELLAQGIGNSLSGLIGGLPMTGVIVRSAANIGAGGRTWRASFFHGVFLAAAVLLIPGVLNRIPLATLAAILIFTGFKLAHPRNFRDAWNIGLKYIMPFAVTVVAILLTDLLIGIFIGLSVGAFFILLDSYRNAYSYDREESADHHHVRLNLAEEVTFLNKASINRALTELPEGTHLVINGSRCRHLDYDVIELLHDFRDTALAKGITLRFVDIPEPHVAATAH